MNEPVYDATRGLPDEEAELDTDAGVAPDPRGEAVTWQREALAAADRASRPDLVRRLTDALVRYEHRQPCRTLALDEELAQ